jgi:hypothetical protein
MVANVSYLFTGNVCRSWIFRIIRRRSSVSHLFQKVWHALFMPSTALSAFIAATVRRIERAAHLFLYPTGFQFHVW